MKFKRTIKKNPSHMEADRHHIKRSGKYIPPSSFNKIQITLWTLNRPLIWVEKKVIEPSAHYLERGDIFKILEKFSILIAVILFTSDFPLRREKAIYEAWSVVNDAEQEKSEVVKLALERLNKENFNLDGIDVEDTNLKKIDLREANFRNSNLEGANLEGANLTGANLGEANLEGANLIGANLEGANLWKAELGTTNLIGANLEGANLEQANLTGANLGEANLEGANLIGANLEGANLIGANIERAKIESASTPTPTPSPIPSLSNKTLYHEDILPVGRYSFYEQGLDKNISYIRQGNKMIGALYDPQQPNTFTCLAATLSGNEVSVRWWGNLGLIGRSGNTLNSSYSIYDFTVGNSAVRAGLDNPSAVESCQKGL